MTDQTIPNSLLEVIRYFSDVDVCIEFVASLRWLDGRAQCPICDWPRTPVSSSPGASGSAARGLPQAIHSVKTGTIFEESPIALDKWLMAIWLAVNCKNGISSYEIARDLKVTQKSAWFMLHRIRLALKDGNWSKLGGEAGGPKAEVDETLCRRQPEKTCTLRSVWRSERGAVGAKHSEKAIVLGMLDRETRQVRADSGSRT